MNNHYAFPLLQPLRGHLEGGKRGFSQQNRDLIPNLSLVRPNFSKPKTLQGSEPSFLATSQISKLHYVLPFDKTVQRTQLNNNPESANWLLTAQLIWRIVSFSLDLKSI
jgi:hypothetical protein